MSNYVDIGKRSCFKVWYLCVVIRENFWFVRNGRNYWIGIWFDCYCGVWLVFVWKVIVSVKIRGN